MMELIKTCCENRELVIIKYDEEDEDLFLYGYIKQYNTKEIIVKCINERGQYNGYALLMVSGIWRINHGGKKLERIRLLYERNKCVGKNMKYKNSRLLYDILEFAKNDKLVTTIFSIDTEIEGYVKQFDDKTAHLKKIDEFGSEEGYSVTNSDKILYLFVDTREGRNRDILYRNVYNHKIVDNRKHKNIVRKCEEDSVDGLMNTINYCYSHNLVTSIFDYDSEQSEDGNWVGVISGYNKKEIMFRHISVDGEYDGYVWKRMNSLCGIAYGGKYEKKIEYLYKHINQEYLAIKRKKKTLLISLLKYAKKNRYIISMITAHGVWTGFVKNYAEKAVELKALDKYAKEDGVVVVKCDEISTIRCNGGDERDVLALYEKQM